MKVLVTGATGFIGGQCLAALSRRGVHICALSSRARRDAADGVEWHQADLLDHAQATAVLESIRPTYLLHLAWIATPGLYWTSLDNIRWLAASSNLLEAFHRHGGQRAVMVGTCAEYEWGGDLYSEFVTPLRPLTLYGVSKDALQRVLSMFGAQAGLSTAWGRVFFTFGPYEHPDRLVPSTIGRLVLGREARCSHGTQIRDFLPSQDVGDALVSLLFSTVAGPINIASGEGVRIVDIVRHIARSLNAETLLRIGARPAADEPASIVADVRRLRDELGWQPPQHIWSRLDAATEWWKGEIESGRVDPERFER